MSDQRFLQKCREFRTGGLSFLAMQFQKESVTYTFMGEAEVKVLEQRVEDSAVRSIAHIFPLADFAERQMYRECGIKSIGNINLVAPKVKANNE